MRARRPARSGRSRRCAVRQLRCELRGHPGIRRGGKRGELHQGGRTARRRAAGGEQERPEAGSAVEHAAVPADHAHDRVDVRRPALFRELPSGRGTDRGSHERHAGIAAGAAARPHSHQRGRGIRQEDRGAAAAEVCRCLPRHRHRFAARRPADRPRVGADRRVVSQRAHRGFQHHRPTPDARRPQSFDTRDPARDRTRRNDGRAGTRGSGRRTPAAVFSRVDRRQRLACGRLFSPGDRTRAGCPSAGMAGSVGPRPAIAAAGQDPARRHERHADPSIRADDAPAPIRRGTRPACLRSAAGALRSGQ